nr:hypothetical protein [Marinobacterium rhizophilum]
MFAGLQRRQVQLRMHPRYRQVQDDVDIRVCQQLSGIGIGTRNAMRRRLLLRLVQAAPGTGHHTHNIAILFKVVNINVADISDTQHANLEYPVIVIIHEVSLNCHDHDAAAQRNSHGNCPTEATGLRPKNK